MIGLRMKGRSWGLLVVLVIGLGCRSRATPTEPANAGAPDVSVQPQASIAGHQVWVGSVALPGQRLYIGVKLRRTDDEAWTGTIDIPAQFVAEGKLVNVQLDDSSMEFTFRPQGAPDSMAAVLSVEIDGDEAKGSLAQGGAEFDVTLGRLEQGQAYAVGPRRPQEPAPPFPYQVVEVEFASKDGTKLSGTLTIPDAAGPHPGVVLMTGSGPQDRDETLAEHKPFLVLADHLTRQGIAVLRYDDRGVPMSEGKYETATVIDFVDDGLAALARLRQHDAIDKAKTGIVGHSQGAVEAAIAGVKSKDVAFVVMLAGFALKGRDLLVLQHEVIFERSGLDEAGVEAQTAAQTALLDASQRGATDDELKQLAAELVELQLAATKKLGTPMPAGAAEPMTAQLVTQLRAPWFRSVLALDPVKWLRRLKRPPVLVVIGAKDTQVPANANMPLIEQALKRAKNADVTLETMDGLNHLFQHADKGTPDEYAEIEETMAPELLDLVTTWIRTHTT